MNVSADENLQEMSLRIKYEGLAKATSAISKAHSFKEMADALQANLKFIFNFSSFRILIFYEQEQLQFEITRQSNSINNGVLNIFRTEAEVMATNIPRVFDERELINNQQLIHPMLQPPTTKNVVFYPLYLNERQQMLIVAGNRENIRPLESDYRFLRLIGDYIFSKCSELILNSRLEQMVLKRTNQLNLANKELSNLFYRASHDFSSPLKTLLGLAELSRIQTFQPADAGEMYHKMVDVINSTQKMLDKLKLISEVESGITVVDHVDLPDLLRDVVDRHRSMAQGIRVSVKYSGETSIVASKDVLTSLLDNLVENSIRFHRPIPDAYIEMSTEVIDGMLTIVIEDNGQGIDPSQHKTIFELYSRANVNSKGNGLGLYLVNKILERMNGTVRVTSHIDVGTRFELRIPLVEDI